MNAEVQVIPERDQRGLLPIEQVNALELFTGGGLDPLLRAIENEARSLVPDPSTSKGRDEIRSNAFRVVRSKTTIDAAGKDLVADWKRKSGEVDAERRRAREFLDGLAEDVRRPLSEWEAEQARIEEEKRLAAEAEAARIAAEAEAALRERERAIAEREAEIARKEAERMERERVEREAAERKAREEQIAREAEERAKRDAEAALQREREARERAEREAQAAEERRQREAVEAEARAKRQAEEAAERERLKAAREAEERERRRRAEEERKRQEEAARAADKANRERVNGEVMAALTAEGVGERVAARIVQLIASGAVPHVSIRY